MKIYTRAASTAFSLSSCFAFMRFVALVLTILSGIWSLVLSQNGDLIMADRLGTIHAVSAFSFLVLVGRHLWAKRHSFARLYRDSSTWRAQAMQTVMPLIAALILASAVSGIAMMAGTSTAIAFHVGAGALLMLIALIHSTLHIVK